MEIRIDKLLINYNLSTDSIEDKVTGMLVGIVLPSVYDILTGSDPNDDPDEFLTPEDMAETLTINCLNVAKDVFNFDVSLVGVLNTLADVMIKVNELIHQAEGEKMEMLTDVGISIGLISDVILSLISPQTDDAPPQIH